MSNNFICLMFMSNICHYKMSIFFWITIDNHIRIETEELRTNETHTNDTFYFALESSPHRQMVQICAFL